jgi:WG containing repeat
MARVVAEGPCFYVDPMPCTSPAILPHGTSTKESVPECKFTFIDSAGRIISQERFEAAGSFAEGVAPVRVGGHWGYLEKNGNLAIPPQFDTAESFSDGLALVSKDDQFGYVDHSGAFVIAPQFRDAEPFANQRAVVGDAGELYWYIDTQGKQAFPEKFATASPFFKGLAHVKLLPKEATAQDQGTAEDVYAYIDVSGKHVFTYKP